MDVLVVSDYFDCYLVTVDRLVRGFHPNLGERVVIERSHGCNGTEHIEQLCKMFYAADNTVEFAQLINYANRRPCDGDLCKKNPNDGFFNAAITAR